MKVKIDFLLHKRSLELNFNELLSLKIHQYNQWQEYMVTP